MSNQKSLKLKKINVTLEYSKNVNLETISGKREASDFITQCREHKKVEEQISQAQLYSNPLLLHERTKKALQETHVGEERDCTSREWMQQMSPNYGAV